MVYLSDLDFVSEHHKCLMKDLKNSREYWLGVLFPSMYRGKDRRQRKHCNLFCGISDENFEFVMRVLDTVKTLKTINLSWSTLSNRKIVSLAKTIELSKTLKKLDLTCTSLENKDLTPLYLALKSNKSVKLIDLDQSGIGDRELEGIGDMLRRNKKLKRIDLTQNNRITSRGVIEIGEALKYNHTLTFLDFDCSDIGDNGVEALESGLLENKSLTILGLGRNNISDKGAEIVKRVLSVNDTLLDIDICNNNISNSLRDDIEKCIERNHRFSWIKRERFEERLGATRDILERIPGLRDLALEILKLCSETKSVVKSECDFLIWRELEKWREKRRR